MLSPLQKQCPKACLQVLGTKGCSEIKTPDSRVGNKTRLPMRLSEGHFKTISSLRINVLIPTVTVRSLRTGPFPAVIARVLRTTPFPIFDTPPPGAALFLVLRNNALDRLLDGRGNAEQRALRYQGAHGLSARLCDEHLLDALPAFFIISIAHAKRVTHKAMRASRLRREISRAEAAFSPRNSPCITRNRRI